MSIEEIRKRSEVCAKFGNDWHHWTIGEGRRAQADRAELLRVIDAVEKLSDEWRLYSEPSWSNHDCANELEAILRGEETND